MEEETNQFALDGYNYLSSIFRPPIRQGIFILQNEEKLKKALRLFFDTKEKLPTENFKYYDSKKSANYFYNFFWSDLYSPKRLVEIIDLIELDENKELQCNFLFTINNDFFSCEEVD